MRGLLSSDLAFWCPVSEPNDTAEIDPADLYRSVGEALREAGETDERADLHRAACDRVKDLIGPDGAGRLDPRTRPGAGPTP